MPQKRLITGIVVVVLILIVVIMWATKTQKKPEGAIENKQQLTIGLARESLGSLVIIAEEKGYFPQEGLDLTIKEYPSGKRALLEGLFAGEVDVATTSDVPIVFNSFGRSDFSIIATIGSSDNEPRIIARKNSGILKQADLKGKKIATQKASAVHFFLHAFLIRNGLSENDIELSFKKAEELPPTLARGEIDAFSMREPFIGLAKTSLGNNAIIFSKKGLYFKTFNLVAFNSFIEEKKETLNRMLRALVRAQEFTKNNPEQATEIISQKLGADKSDISALWPDLKLQVSLNQSLLITLEDEARWVIKNNFTDATEVPNYLNYIYLDSLRAVKPESVGIIH